MKALVGTFNQEKALVGAFSVITNLRMELFQALVQDLNDNVPEFINIRSYYVYSTQEDECKDCNIEARDADTGEYIHLGNYLDI